MYIYIHVFIYLFFNYILNLFTLPVPKSNKISEIMTHIISTNSILEEIFFNEKHTGKVLIPNQTYCLCNFIFYFFFFIYFLYFIIIIIIIIFFFLKS